MNQLHSRRAFLRRTAGFNLAASLSPVLVLGAEPSPPPRRWRLCLSPGSIGVAAKPREVLLLAHQHGFEAVEPNSGFLAGLSAAELADWQTDMKAKGLTWGAAGLPVEFRGDDARFRTGLAELPKLAAALQRAGVDRVGTWISPGHNQLTYIENFREHAQRLRELARVLRDQGQRLGLEYVGTPSARQGRRYPFIHSKREAQELIAEIGTGNVGLVLDSWHWWTARETEADLLALKPTDVISVDLNDAPAGLTLEQQQDGKRELPCATGVIPTAAFVNALQQIGYDGPVRAEPFNKAVNDLADDAACAAVIGALRKAVALLKSQS
jgi:sugar phosphate isomerase/epimerase